jgi:high-affinity Fe2+/Pb2+ permease
VENLRDGVESFVIFSKMILYANNKKLFLSSATVVMVLLAMLSYIVEHLKD